ncbi:hypothetical protein BAE44_0021355 [Dichanthelium oligosanthes]|uniref:MATH domain-containing protein n=1 Tax=Dichanthelium oligosanthes TaxID=888268 RepID=A0A1E5UXL3_9POAL|nr:hypothetical protein BAE44_0021355 [Dichanthelium oligosanthes]
MGNSCVTSASPALVRKTDDPAFEWKICGFSALLERGAIPASSALFLCCGYEWFLQVVPMHDRHGDESPYVSDRHEDESRFSFAANVSCWGWSDFILLWIWMHWVLACLAGSNFIVKADIAIIGSSTDG